jgi:hypothetical protein
VIVLKCEACGDETRRLETDATGARVCPACLLDGPIPVGRDS